MDDRATKLLLKAVRRLPEREQDQLLAALLQAAAVGGGSVAQPVSSLSTIFEPLSPRDRAAALRAAVGPQAMTVTQPIPGQGRASDPTAMLPVRLPPELHERLRRWSGTHGFSMASVIRGLVERFLDEQEGKKRRSSATTTKPKARSSPVAAPKRKRPTTRG